MKLNAIVNLNTVEPISTHLNITVQAIEIKACRWMNQNGLSLLRLSLGIIFVWFGILKPFHLSPAQQLVEDTIAFLMLPPEFVSILGYWEVAIGVFICFHSTTRLALVLLFLHMPGTMLPLVLLPDICWTQFPYGLTMEGQYIIKNLALVSAAILIGGTLHYQTLSGQNMPAALR